MDNLFSIPKLFCLLRELDIGVTGTVQTNAGGIPKSLEIRGKKNVQLNWDTLQAELCKDGLVLATTWIDNGAV